MSRSWQNRIVSLAERKLGRPLTESERRFITSRGGGIALEMIHDSVEDLEGEQLVDYLRSEERQGS